MWALQGQKVQINCHYSSRDINSGGCWRDEAASCWGFFPLTFWPQGCIMKNSKIRNPRMLIKKCNLPPATCPNSWTSQHSRLCPEFIIRDSTLAGFWSPEWVPAPPESKLFLIDSIILDLKRWMCFPRLPRLLNPGRKALQSWNLVFLPCAGASFYLYHSDTRWPWAWMDLCERAWLLLLYCIQKFIPKCQHVRSKWKLFIIWLFLTIKKKKKLHVSSLEKSIEDFYPFFMIK